MRAFCILFFIGGLSLFSYSQCVNTFPYSENFESSNGNWVSGGTGNDWAWGAVSKPVIAQAGSGVNCWVTGGLTSSFYTFGERSYVQSPCFDFTSLQVPHISFHVFWETEKTYDGACFQYTIDGGLNWFNLGTSGDAVDCLNQNWFNTSSINNLSSLANPQEGWAGNVQSTSGSCQGGGGSSGWQLAQHCMPQLGGKPNVIFRFAFGAGTQCNSYDGFAFDDITIEETPLPVVDFSVVCNGNTFAFAASTTLCPNVFSWDFGDGSFGNGLTTTHQYTTPGNYTVTLNAHGSCSPDVIVTKPIQMLQVNASSFPLLCAGDNSGKAFVTASGGSNYTYSWNTSPVQTTDTAFNLAAGNYTVTVSSAGFCDAVANVIINEPAAIANSFSVTADTCYTNTGALLANVSGGNSPYSFVWSTGGIASNQLGNLPAGNYSLSVTDANNCSITAQAAVPYVSGISLAFTVKNILCDEAGNGEITVTPIGGILPYTYAWSNNAATPTVSNLTEATYAVTVTDANLCSNTDSALLQKEPCPAYIYFPTAFSPNADGVNDFFRPKYSFDLTGYYIRIYNRWGELVYQSDDVNEGWNGLYKNTTQPMSTYVWVAEYSFSGKQKSTAAGNMTLIR